MRHRSILGRAAAGFCAVAVAVPTVAQGIYTCVDGKGRKLTSDRPIIECIDREQRELNSSGTTRRTVGPSLTAQEHAALEARDRRAAEEAARASEERRRDRALLARYGSRAAHDEERAQAITQVDMVIAAAKKRVVELVVDRSKLEAEMEFYAKDPAKAPALLKRQIAGVEQSVALQQRFIADQQSEKKRINGRFDEELARLNLLWAAQTGGFAAAAPLKSATTSAVR